MSYRVVMQDVLDNPKIAVAGCGGTGGFVAEGLCRLIPNKTVPLILIDHDRVEPHNLLRQNFFAGDVGKFKSQALAERLARQYGRQVGYMVYPYERELLHNRDSFVGFQRQSSCLIIGCVDNAAARQAIADGLEMGDWWIDAGNGHHSGQVLIGNAKDVSGLEGGFLENEDLVSRLPAPSLQLPSLLMPVPEPETRRRDCAEAVEAEEQSPVINQTMAALVLEFVNKLIHGTLTWMGAYLDLEAGTLATVPAEPEVVSRMCGVKVDTLMQVACSRGMVRAPRRRQGGGI